MIRVRTILLGVAALIVVPLLVAMGVAAWALWELPPSQGERVRGPHGAIGVQGAGGYVWVVPAGEDAVVLIDAGPDPEAKAVRGEVRDRDVLAVLLTHAHPEQIGGLTAFPGVPVYVGGPDQKLLSGEVQPGGWLASWFSTMVPPPEITGEIRSVVDGAVLTLGEATFRAILVPGHTMGSVVWLWEDVLFTGGALLASSPLKLPPAALSDDPALARRSLDASLPVAFDHVADAHVGTVSNARADLHRLLGARQEEPQIRLRDPQIPGPMQGPKIEATGVYVQRPEPGPDGLAPALLVQESGETWVISAHPVPGHAALVGRRVVVRGTLLAPAARPGMPGGPSVAIDSVELAKGESPADGRLPLVTTEAGLRASLQRWARVRGTVRELEPLARRAQHAEGRLELEDTTVALSAPSHTPLERPVDLLARIVSDGGNLRVVSTRVCDDAAPCP